MSNNPSNTFCLENTEKIIFCICYVLSAISLLALILFIFKVSNSSLKKSLITNGLFIITLSEILNCFMILLNISIMNKIKYINEVRKAQSFFSIYSDLSTLLASMVLCIKFYRSSKNLNKPFCFTSIISIRIIAMLIPFCLAALFCFINYNKYIDQQSDGDEVCKPWSWVHSQLSVILYGIYWIIITITVFFNCKATCHLNHKKEIFESNDETDDCKEVEPFSNPTLDLTSIIITEQITSTVNKLNIFPWVVSGIWLLISLDRVPDDIAMIRQNKLFKYEGALSTIKTISVGMHSGICAVKGLVFCFCFLWIDHKLFENIKNTLICNKDRRTIPSFTTEITESLPPKEK